MAMDDATRALGPNGKPLGTRPVVKRAAMTAEECARQTVDAMTKRKREVLMAKRAKIGMLVKAIAPEVVDRLALRAITRGR